jgi:hypothetical protein
MDQNLLPRFANAIFALGARGVSSPELCLGTHSRYTLQFTPFEHVNPNARIVIVGITPGNTQLELAYSRVQGLLKSKAPFGSLSLEAKKAAAFGGTMRANLVRLLNHFGVGEWLGIGDASSLWGTNAHLLESTSVVPHAAFKNGKMFAGSFEEILANPLLRECFHDCFVRSLDTLSRAELYLALGPTPQAALRWCAEHGRIDGSRIAAFPHPSPSAGSQIRYFLREIGREALNPRDPTRHRAEWLDAAYLQALAVFSNIRAQRELSLAAAGQQETH